MLLPTFLRERREAEARAAGEAERNLIMEDNAIQRLGASFWATEDREKDLDKFGKERTDISKRIFVAPDPEEMDNQGDRIVEVVIPVAEDTPDLRIDELTDDQQLQDDINIKKINTKDSSSELEPAGSIIQSSLELVQTLTDGVGEMDHLLVEPVAENVKGNDVTLVEDVTLEIMAHTHIV